jgi:hypothetical protein
LAKRLGLDRRRVKIVPVSFGFPFGLSVFIPANLPLPANIVAQVLEPIDVVEQFSSHPDIGEVDAYVRAVMQQRRSMDRPAEDDFRCWADTFVDFGPRRAEVFHPVACLDSRVSLNRAEFVTAV